MSNKTGFWAFCSGNDGCGAKLRSEQRLKNHKNLRCNARTGPRKNRQETQGGKKP